ncbi:MAG TPA: peptidoglycan editing factor PgeF [Gammaproteobacteria bacterium]|nr:peptidoglycan editing factor PgeF [Gammaproteobacteria bacterium]
MTAGFAESASHERLWLPADWPAPPGVRGGTTRRGWPGGVSEGPWQRLNLAAHVGDDERAVASNRAALITALALPAPPTWLAQVHGTRVLSLDGLDGLDGPAVSADGACTARADRVAVVLTADCLPVLLASEDGRWVAALHAGWRGLANGVLEAGVRAWPGPPERLLAWLGPAIGPSCFEVDAPVREAFRRADPAAEAAFTAGRPGHWLCDLYLLASQRLVAAGVTRVHGGGRCTASETGEFYSYRRDGTASGRMATLVWLGAR